MGLDMYLYAKEYVSGNNYGHDSERGYFKEPNQRFSEFLDAMDLTYEDVEEDMPSAHIKFKIMQWRKANAIHQWFVENVQGGVDDCGEYYVSTGQLEDLRGTLGQALAIRDGSDSTPIEDVLPTQSGFFFGGTEYDEWYWKDIEYTYNKIDQILNNRKFENYDFEYSSSW